MAYENITGTPARSQLRGPGVTEPVLGTTFISQVLQPIADNIELLLQSNRQAAVAQPIRLNIFSGQIPGHWVYAYNLSFSSSTIEGISQDTAGTLESILDFSSLLPVAGRITAVEVTVRGPNHAPPVAKPRAILDSFDATATPSVTTHSTFIDLASTQAEYAGWHVIGGTCDVAINPAVAYRLRIRGEGYGAGDFLPGFTVISAVISVSGA